MHFDDRLATVLRNRAGGERAAKTQFRQLIDLLGERPQAGDKALKAAAYLRLIALGEMISVADRAAIVGENGWRFRNPELVKWFGEAHPHIAAAALYRANLTGEEWEEIIPRLPIRARGFLRHRRDLPVAAERVLDALGVSDRALPQPVLEQLSQDAVMPPPPVEEPEDTPEEILEEPAPLSLGTLETSEAPADEKPAPEDRPIESGKDGIRALVDRIEAFQKVRSERVLDQDDPRLPLGEKDAASQARPLDQFVFGSDTDGRIDWAESGIAQMVVGIDLAHAANDEDHAVRALRMRQPLSGLAVHLRGAGRIEGDWIVDATPRFTRSEGRFYGYVGRFRRAVSQVEDRREAEADRLRQLLHELRTPVNAMQGYAEIIQQQVIGPVPHEYRAIAATIAGDAAHILAGFEELDRLAKLETGSLELEQGDADFAAIARKQVAQLQPVLSPRVARFDTDFGEGLAPIALSAAEAERLAWRLLATIAGTLSAGEAVAIKMETGREQVEFALSLPSGLKSADDVFSVETRANAGALSAGIFGAGFSLRLARAEARAAGGELARVEDALVLSLPLLTGVESLPSPEGQPDNATG
ncbi:sensor histidine kinase [Qipengyuania seohaensis]|uniref:sensor histidine kinase n=1 Tax=Qipengyuania seohaensis TaxID=266951 RepID=UPI000C223A18|nr:histidine kinase dimerization/phospho-acceptor domain-containing protein [Qipengyuania seohaensis]